jgi:outer membrane protein OmpA-like peptidoglycan-associated protein
MLHHDQTRSIHLRRVLPLVALAVAAGTAGCGGPVQFADTRPIAIVGTLPPPPEKPKPERVVVKKDRIEIKEKIQFDFDKATIKPESHDLLNEIVTVIKKNPQIKKLSIEGHTSSEGTDKYNQGLSERRAASVRGYLVEHGIGDGALTSKGFGESKPLADNESDAGKEKNRRVEFMITEQDEITETYEVDPATGQRRVVGQAAPAPEGGK